jgi:hypothetical protein
VEVWLIDEISILSCTLSRQPAGVTDGLEITAISHPPDKQIFYVLQPVRRALLNANL